MIIFNSKSWFALNFLISGMQNGCICCTLQSDLVDQIVNLTQKKKFNYVLIEASGVSEPHEIAPLFEVHPHYHMDHADEEDHDHETPQLGEVEYDEV